MSHPPISIVRGVERSLDSGPCPIDLDRLLPPADSAAAAPSSPATASPATASPATSSEKRSWQVEIGFGKGRFLLGRALATPDTAFLGIEMVSKYARLLAGRAARQGVDNLAVLRGEALYLLATYLPRGFADTLHVYFPDPWPKSKHHRRRLFDPASVDLVLGVLRPGGRLEFATDFLSYGERVETLLADAPQVARLARRETPWPDGARTNYEAKYLADGRPILRLEATLRDADTFEVHPAGRGPVLAAITSVERAP